MKLLIYLECTFENSKLSTSHDTSLIFSASGLQASVMWLQLKGCHKNFIVSRVTYALKGFVSVSSALSLAGVGSHIFRS